MRLSTAAVIAAMMLMLLTIVAVFGAIIARLVQDHIYANKYRELLKLHAESSTGSPSNAGPRWRVVYKDGGKQRILTLPASNEAEAMRQVLQKGIEPRSIITLEPSA